jgi:hypothetical protein
VFPYRTHVTVLVRDSSLECWKNQFTTIDPIKVPRYGTVEGVEYHDWIEKAGTVGIAVRRHALFQPSPTEQGHHHP